MMSANAGAAPHAAPARDDNAACRAARRYAMISVYYRSLGSQLESRGAPVMAVPPEVRPLSLGEALDRLKDCPEELWAAYWSIVRSVPVDRWNDGRLDRRYPPELIECLCQDGVAELDDCRKKARANAHILGAALIAYAAGRGPEAEDLVTLVGKSGDAEQLDDAAEATLGYRPHRLVCDFVTDRTDLRHDDDHPEQRAGELNKLQDQVGLNLNEFVENFLDTIAFAQFMSERTDTQTPLTSSCIVRQDTNTLTTTATVTSLVRTSFDALKKMLDPLGWDDNSDVIRKTRYVEGPYDLTSTDDNSEKLVGTPFNKPRFLYEDVAVSWGDDSVQTGEFRNVLVIGSFRINEQRGTLTLPFRLCRSINSTILWDRRDGGILVDDGYIVVRPVGKQRDLFRLTARKILRFSDRTPYSSAPGLLDFGQMLNYLSPAAVTWWLETDMYSAKRVHKAEGS
jgi:hypothetical protein